MTVGELIKEIIEKSESIDQKIILFSEIDVDGGKFKGAVEHNNLNIDINGNCLQLFMRD